MNIELDIRVTELLCSRLCHELVSPVSAINNGVELIEEMGEDMAEEAIKLIAHSADQAARRLRLLRLAYGAAGSDASSMADAQQAAESYFAGGKIRLDWPAGRIEAGAPLKRGSAKLLLNLTILAEEALAHGGTVAVERSAGGLTVTANGRSAALRPEVEVALGGGVASGDLSPRSVHAFATGRFAAYFDLPLALERQGPDCLAFHLQA